MDDLIEARKGDHLRLAAAGDAEAPAGAGWDDVRLLHDALPEVDRDAVDVSVEFLGRRLRAPLIIAGMTGGHATALEVNAVLARAAERHGLAIGVGSQRAALRQPALAHTYTVVRQHAPSALVIANIGAPQLIDQAGVPALGLDEVDAAIDMLAANALAVHLNFLQESVQPEGDRRALGCAAAIQRVVGHCRARTPGLPVIAKETGAGLSRATALRLRDLGVAALDVGGVGGTSFAAIEGQRAAAQGFLSSQHLGELLRDWGLPTPVSVIGARITGLPLIATGGIRSGLDAARALALGASVVGVARPLLQAALAGDAAVDAWLDQFLVELRTTLFLAGSRTIADLQARPRVILGATRQWIEQLHYA